jgi:hypothetical protein
MRRIALIGVIATATYAQAQTFEPAVPSGISEVRVEPTGELLPPELVMNRNGTDADARSCLGLSTNAQIHDCAERYRAKANRSVRSSVKVGKIQNR